MQIELVVSDAHQTHNGDSAEGAKRIDADGRPIPPSSLSPSGASTYEQCPRRWRFRYIERLDDPPGIDALVGTFAHRVLELLMQQVEIRRTKSQARHLARSIWPEMEECEEYRDLQLSPKEGLEFRIRAWRAIDGLWNLEDPTDVCVESTEEHLTATLRAVPFRGVVDRLDRAADGLVVTDYKSGRAPSAYYASARLQQVLLYAAAVAESRGELPVRAQLLYLGQRIVSTHVTASEINGAVDQFSETWDNIAESCANDTFAPRTGPLCEYCAFASHCDEGRVEVERRVALRTAEEASLLRLAS